MKLKPAVRCLNRNQLKYIAAAAMAIDHIAAFFFPLSGGFYIVCRVIGRLTSTLFPNRPKTFLKPEYVTTA